MAEDLITKKITEVQNFTNGDLGTIIQVQGDEIGQTNVGTLKQDITNSVVTELTESGGVSLNLINMKGVVPTYADLPNVEVNLNDAYQVEADGLVYVYTENGFQDEGNGFIVQAEPTGVVEEGNEQAVSGDTVFKSLPKVVAGNTVNLFNYKTDFITGKYINTTSANLVNTGTHAVVLKISLPAGTYVLNRAANASFSAHRIEKQSDGSKIETGNPTNLNNSAYPKGEGGVGYLISVAEDFIFYTNAELASQSTANWLDLTKVQIQSGNKVTDYQPYEYLKSVDGLEVYYPSNTGSQRFKNKSGIAAGDSITAGADFGSYVPKVADITGAFIQNLGSSGARTGRLTAILTDIKDRKDTSNVYVTPDWANVDFCTIMIGTNTDTVGEISTIPALDANGLNPMNYPGTSDVDKLTYLTSFPNNYIGNLALILEFIIWKNPKIQIFMISTIQNNVPAGNYINGTTVSNKPDAIQYRNALLELQKIYNFKLIDAYMESGLTKRNFMKYSYDGVHLNAIGVDMLGNYVGNKLNYF